MLYKDTDGKLLVTSNGKLLAGCGPIYLGGAGTGDNLLKINSVWTKLWGKDVTIYHRVAIDVGRMGNVYVCGLEDGSDYLVWKYNNAGTLQWRFKFPPGEGGGDAYGIAVTSGGIVYIAGDFTFGGLVKLDTDGSFLWDAYPSQVIAKVAYDPVNDQIYVVGDSLRRYSSAGVQLKDFVLGICYSVAVDDDVNVYVGRGSNVKKYNSSDVLQWTYVTSDQVNDIAIDADKNVYLAVNGTVALKSVIKLNSAGELQWDYDSGFHEEAVAVENSAIILSGGMDGKLRKFNAVSGDLIKEEILDGMVRPRTITTRALP